MDTINQIQHKIYEVQEKSRMMEKIQREVLTLQSEINTLVIDLKYDHQAEMFLARRA